MEVFFEAKRLAGSRTSPGTLRRGIGPATILAEEADHNWFSSQVDSTFANTGVATATCYSCFTVVSGFLAIEVNVSQLFHDSNMYIYIYMWQGPFGIMRPCDGYSTFF